MWVAGTVLPLRLLLDEQAFKDSGHWKPEIVQINRGHHKDNYSLTGYLVWRFICNQDLKQDDGLVLSTITI